MALRRPVAFLAAALLAAALAVAVSAQPADAATVYKNGAEINTAQANCFPLRGFPAYTQQTAVGSTTGAEPKVEDVFYISLTVSFFQTYDCAADFLSTVVTLPPNVQPAIGGSASPICRRYGGSSGSHFFDPRAPQNCPTSVDFNSTTREFRIGPRSGATTPDFGPPAGQFFIGQRSPQEAQIYHSVQLLVPVRATATMTNQPVQFLLCSVGTSCSNGSVPLSVDPAPLATDPPLVSLPGDPFTSATGARIPFTINTSNNNGYYLKVDASTSSTFNGGRPCAGLPTTYERSANTPFTGDFSSETQFGDLQTGGTACNLVPNTTYYFKACSVRTSDLAELNCRTTQFKTGIVTSGFAPPEQSAAGIPGNTSAIAKGHQVIGGHPAGTLTLGYRLKGSTGMFTQAASESVGASTTSSTPKDRTITSLTPWRVYELQSCFASGGTFCTNAVDLVTGFATAPSDASEVGETSARLFGQASAPSPAGDMRFLVGTTNPGTRDARTLLAEAAAVPMAARESSGDSVSTVVGGLTPGTAYYWVACFDNPAQAGIEDCSDPRSFTTAGTAPAPGGGGDPGGPADGGPGGPTDGGSGGATAGADLINGTAAGETLCGLLGNDTINGLGGDDILFGDACNDTLKSIFAAQVATDGNDKLNGGDGNDKLYGAGGKDTLKGGKGRDQLFGGDGNDSLSGEDGKDSLNGGGGNDKLTGGKDSNTYKGGAGNDVLSARNGKKDTIDCGAGKKDKATVDKVDKVKGCETVARPRK